MSGHAIDELLRLALERARSLGAPPISTYRIQFHAGFTFADAAAIVPYLAELGVTHIYASPYLASVAGSTHGYDVIDHNRINPQLGTEEDYETFLNALKKAALSHILDMVPNHVGVDTNDNVWWNSVLEHGRASPFARYFDIAWRESANPDLYDRVLLPILGQPYGKALEEGQLKLTFDADKDCFFLNYFQRRIPLSRASDELILDGNPRPAPSQIARIVQSINGKPGDRRSFDRMDALLARQNYRLEWWRVAPDEINYRRFFDINGLAALAMQRIEVFTAVHALALRLAAEGKIAGLRIDHPDGLYDPQQYLRRLQLYFVLACAEQIVRDRPEYRDVDWKATKGSLIQRLNKTPDQTSSFFVVVEKILALDERLPANWMCHGTSGYDFLAMVNELFIDSTNEAAFTRIYEAITGQTEDFGELAYHKKRMMLERSFTSDWRRLARQIAALARKDRRAHDFTRAGLQHALGELIACFPVYRSYVNSSDIRPADREYLAKAAQRAIDRNPQTPADIFHFVRDMILQRSPDSFTDKDRARQLKVAAKFQQLTSPTTAKGVEDTAFYVYQRLISLNEVGGDPSRFGIEPDALHRYLSDRQRHWPFALNPLSTHDTKRSEDVRARLNVLAEIPDEWEKQVTRWIKLNAPHRHAVRGTLAPALDEQYLLYQTIVGIFPLLESAQVHELFVGRIQQYMQKAIREAKLRTSWTDPDQQWEKAIETFVAAALDQSCSGEFLADIAAFSRRIAHYGLINSLSQTLLRLAAPGVPDTYQGTELWDFSLVDPDNRRPVDYALRQRMIAKLKQAPSAASIRGMLGDKEDGSAKLWLIRQALHCRRKYSDLFTIGDYLPIEAIGPRARHVFAFGRRHGHVRAIAALPRFTATLAPGERLPLGTQIWDKTRLRVPDDFGGCTFENVLTGERIVPAVTDGVPELMVADILANFPVALLLNDAKVTHSSNPGPRDGLSTH
jgi:(1->4)-alpha-D-glucan 1-alpha-D-glucosylmutase